MHSSKLELKKKNTILNTICLKKANRNYWTLDARVRRWTLEAGLWPLDSGRWTLDVGRWTRGATLWTLGSGRWILSLFVSEQNQNPVSDAA